MEQNIINIIFCIIAFIFGGVCFWCLNELTIKKYVKNFIDKHKSEGKEVYSADFLYGKKYVSVRDKLFIILGSVCCSVSIYEYGFRIHFILLFIFLSLLAAIAIVDADTLTIPDRYAIYILLLGVISIMFENNLSVLTRIIGMFSLSVPFFILSRIIKDSFGDGDIKLLAVTGFYLGWENMMLGTYIGTVLAAIYGIFLLLHKKRGGDNKFAFGPFLCLGMAISAITGEFFIWYLREYIYSFIEMIQ